MIFLSHDHDLSIFHDFSSFNRAGNAASELTALATSPEKLANTTAEGFIEVNAEMIALRAVAMQNHIALDVLLAAQGRTCAIIGTECYTYIPDNSEQIVDLSARIRQRELNTMTMDGNLGLG